MSYYRKFISYIDVYEHNEKIRNIGFIKSEVRDDIWKLNIIIKGLQETDTLICEIKAVDSGQHLEQIQLVNGGGSYTFIYNIKELLNGEVLFSDIKGLRFQLSSNRYGLCRWEQPEQKEETKKEPDQINPAAIPIKTEYSSTEPEAAAWQYVNRITKEAEPERRDAAEEKQKGQDMPEAEPKGQDTAKPEPKGREFWEQKYNQNEFKNAKIKAQEIKAQDVEVPEETVQDVALPNYKFVNISSDKWQQLCRMYPEVHPFEEEETGEFISVQPKDFVIMNQNCQGLVNNSFLLHGYFNYKHILLGKKKIEKQFRYYIGVPGIFQDREKMVAVMFGFEAFEAVEKEIQGAFGYYMKEVEI